MPQSDSPDPPWYQASPAPYGNPLPHIHRQNALPPYPKMASDGYNLHYFFQHNQALIPHPSYYRRNCRYRTSCQAYRSAYTSQDTPRGSGQSPSNPCYVLRKNDKDCRTTLQTLNYSRITPYRATLVHRNVLQTASHKLLFALPF